MESKIGPCLLAVIALGACQMKDAIPVEGLPSKEDARLVAIASYAHTEQRQPEGLQIHDLHQRNVFGDGMDVLACLSTVEHRDHPIYDAYGQLRVEEGEPYRRKYAMLMRHYGSGYGVIVNGWGSGVLRRVTPNTKIGFVQLAELCGS